MSVEDSPELEVCERNVPEPLVGPAFRAVELLPRTPSGESGIGRRRRSVQCLAGLPERGCGGQVTGSPGSEEPTGSTGSVTSTGHLVFRRATDLCRGRTDHRRRALVAHTYEGPSPISEPERGRSAPAKPAGIRRSERHGELGRQAVCRRPTRRSPREPLDWSGPHVNRCGRFLWRSGENLWTGAGKPVEQPEEIGRRREQSRKALVGLGSTGIVTGTGHQVFWRTPASCRAPGITDRRALVAHTDRGPSAISVAPTRGQRRCWASHT
jgi:hypothetical protein